MLEEKEELFVQEYIKLRNPEQAYTNAFGVEISKVGNKPYKLLKRKDIAERYAELKELKDIDPGIGVKDYINFLVRGACADLSNYLEFDVEYIPELNPDGTVKVNVDTGEAVVRRSNKLYIKSCKNADMSLIEGISNGKDGVKITLVSKMECWRRLNELFGWTVDSKTKNALNTKILEAIAGRIGENWGEGKDEYDDLHETLNREE